MFCFTTLISLLAPANALSPDISMTGVLPESGSEDVAVNVAPVITTSMLSITHEGSQDDMADHVVALYNQTEDTFVPATVEPLAGDVYQVVPAEPLAANTRYIITSDPPIIGGDADGQVTTFTTGDWVDETVPTIPQPLSVYQTTTTDEWGDWHAFTVEQRPAGDMSGVIYTVDLVRLDCAMSPDCAEAASASFIGDGFVSEPNHENGYQETEALVFRDDPAGASQAGATFALHDTVVKISTVDLAGNAAALVCSVPEGYDPAEVGCEDAAASGTHSADDYDFVCGTTMGGCSSIPASAASGLLALLGLFAAGRRREC